MFAEFFHQMPSESLEGVILVAEVMEKGLYKAKPPVQGGGKVLPF